MKGFLGMILFFVGIFAFLAFGEWLGNRSSRKQEEEAIRDGRLRVISHAEYNRAFGIKNELKLVDGELCQHNQPFDDCPDCRH